ncbi:4-oxalocrotonate tautomerase family protein [Streptomyces fagopyri]|uniref:tautomerase family protein n=1 Tax=Streptomyces fagopyri TaxID=2662397 RepID=UPI0037232778
MDSPRPGVGLDPRRFPGPEARDTVRPRFDLDPAETTVPLIHVRQTPGRTAEQKAELARDLTDA